MIIDPERSLALAYTPARLRYAVEILWKFDTQLAEVVRTTSQPAIGQMRLTWWHHALETPPDGQPLLAEMVRVLPPLGVGPASLQPMIDGWERLLEPGALEEEALRRYAAERGGTLFDAVARMFGAAVDPSAGARWALVDLAFHVRDDATAEAAIAMARALPAGTGRPPAVLRVLDRLARHDARRGLAGARRPGSPGRMMRAAFAAAWR